MSDLPVDDRATALSLLSEALLRTLGRYGCQDNLLGVLRQVGLDSSDLLRQGPVLPYPVVWPEYGLTVLMQDMKPDAPPQDHVWGLHSITWEAESWHGPWPKGLNPDTTTADDIARLLAQDKTKALCTPEMACSTTAGLDGQTWAAVALFDPVSSRLQNLTLARHGDWVAASTLASDPAPATPPITCSTGDMVPKTGWYEGMMPEWHPNHASFNHSDERFVYREVGQRMSRLYVKPHTYDGLVTWTWRGEK